MRFGGRGGCCYCGLSLASECGRSSHSPSTILYDVFGIHIVSIRKMVVVVVVVVVVVND